MGFFGNLFGGGNNSNTNYNMTIDQKCRFMTASFESTLCNTIENSLYQSTPQGIASVVIESVIRNKQKDRKPFFCHDFLENLKSFIAVVMMGITCHKGDIPAVMYICQVVYQVFYGIIGFGFG